MPAKMYDIPYDKIKPDVKEQKPEEKQETKENIAFTEEKKRTLRSNL